MERKIINRKHFSFWSLNNRTFTALSHLACFECADTVRLHRNMPRHVPTLWCAYWCFFILSNANLDFRSFVFRRRRAVFILLAMPPPSLERAALGWWCGWFKPLLKIRHAAALTTGAKHWHRQKAVFYIFCFSPPSIYPLNLFLVQIAEKMSKIYLNVVGIFHILNIFRKFVVEIMGAISRRFPSGASHSLSLIFIEPQIRN